MSEGVNRMAGERRSAYKLDAFRRWTEPRTSACGENHEDGRIVRDPGERPKALTTEDSIGVQADRIFELPHCCWFHLLSHCQLAYCNSDTSTLFRVPPLGGL